MPFNTRIAVLESRWWESQNTSVKGLFDLLSDIHYGNPHEYFYETMNSCAGAREAIPRIGTLMVKYLYLAAHGHEDGSGLALGNGETLTRTHLKNALAQIRGTNGSNLDGIFLGSCFFGTASLANFLFRYETGIDWVIGYETAVDWIPSSVLDLFVLNFLVQSRGNGMSQRQLITNCAIEVREKMPGLAANLGFHIYVRRRGRNGGHAEDLLVDLHR